MSTIDLDSLPDISEAEKLSIAEALGVQILSATHRGGWWVRCPGAHLHTHPELDGDKVAWIKFERDGNFHQWIACFHKGGSCRAVRREMNSKISSAIAVAKCRQAGIYKRPSLIDNTGGRLIIKAPPARPQVTAARPQVSRVTAPTVTATAPTTTRTTKPTPAPAIITDEAQILAAKRKRAEILANTSWDVPQIIADSPSLIVDDDEVSATIDWFRFLSLFEADDVLWVGRINHSAGADKSEFARERAARHFRTRTEWARAFGVPPDSDLTTGSTFRPGAHQRSLENVVTQRYLIVEGDDVLNAYEGRKPTPEEITANQNACGAIFAFLRKTLKLRMILTSGSKSLHAWFEFPTGINLARLRLVLRGLGLDSSCATSCQPCRIPGGFNSKTANQQRVLWFADAA